MKKFGWVIIGPGKIAHRFSDAVRRMEGTHLVAVHGRDPDRTQSFAQTWSRDGAPPVRALENLDALLHDPEVDGVYIATPHSAHAEAVRRCLQAGKPVLCEKPLAPTQATAIELVEMSRQQNVFLMEGIWTRFLPAYAVVREWLQSQAIGRVHGMQSSFFFNVPFDPASRVYDPAQAGGALLDIGIYNLTVTRWVLQAAMGRCPALQSLHASGVIGTTGVDQRVSVALNFSDGVVSQFVCGVDGIADNSFRIFGERGVITIAANFWEATDTTLHRTGEAPISVHRPHRLNGFEGEIEEAMLNIAIGNFESPVVPHAETVATLGWMDRIRADIGVRYPFEQT